MEARIDNENENNERKVKSIIWQKFWQMSNKPVQSKKETFNRQLKLEKKSNYNISQETISKEIFNNEGKAFTESLLF